MPIPRSQLIDLNVTPYYRCFNRCVRQEYLLGENGQGKDVSHRKHYFVTLLKSLTEGFGIRIPAYAVMSNHYHAILHVDKELVLSWSDAQVVERWQKVAKTRETPDFERLAIWRERLYDISWFMRFLNERMARICNKEDNKKGRFWDNRFKSQPLLDEGALLACMTYVDLNVIRSGQAETLETSDFTSIQERLRAYESKQASPDNLMTFQTPMETPETTQNDALPPSRPKLKGCLPFALSEYLNLVDWTGRQIREGKGHIAYNAPSIVEVSGLEPKQWLNIINYYHSPHKNIMGAFASVRDWAHKVGKSWLKGQKDVRQYYLTPA